MTGLVVTATVAGAAADAVVADESPATVTTTTHPAVAFRTPTYAPSYSEEAGTVPYPSTSRMPGSRRPSSAAAREQSSRQSRGRSGTIPALVVVRRCPIPRPLAVATRQAIS